MALLKGPKTSNFSSENSLIIVSIWYFFCFLAWVLFVIPFSPSVKMSIETNFAVISRAVFPKLREGQKEQGVVIFVDVELTYLQKHRNHFFHSGLTRQLPFGEAYVTHKSRFSPCIGFLIDPKCQKLPLLLTHPDFQRQATP